MVPVSAIEDVFAWADQGLTYGVLGLASVAAYRLSKSSHQEAYAVSKVAFDAAVETYRQAAVAAEERAAAAEVRALAAEERAKAAEAKLDGV